MASSRTTRFLLVVALTAASLVASAGMSFADSEKSNGTVHLDERFEGWFSNGMTNDPAACGPFTASESAVVWHLYLEVPSHVGTSDLAKVKVDFGGKVEEEIKYQVSDGRADIWARVTLKKPDSQNYARQGAHTSIRKARAQVADATQGRSGSIQLGNVCYQGLGPIGEVTFYLQGMDCDGFDRFDGNQVTDSSDTWDQTAGDWRLWNKVYEKDAPTVKVAGRTKGCDFSGSQRFAVGTSSDMANRYVIPATTSAADNGLIKISSADLPEEHQRALFWANEELWFERFDNHQLGAFQCYDDRLHADNVEWILIRDYDKLPSTITCVAWNVTAQP